MALTRPLLSQLNTNIIAFSDNMMVINAGNIANRDLGIVFDRSVNSQSNVALFWQESSSSFTFAQTTSSGLNNANIVVGLTSNVVLGNIILSGIGSPGIYYANGSAWTGGGTGSPGGVSTAVQFNDLGVFGGNSQFTYNKTTNTLTVGNISVNANGQGTNILVGDDIFLGDINTANTLGLRGNQDPTQSYIVFGSSNGQTLGRSGTGALTYQGGFTAQGGITNTPIGNATAAAGTFTTLTVTSTSSLNGTVSTNNILPFGNANANIGSTSLRFNTVFAKATSAQYADLAEIYTADQNYEPGTVVVFGGTNEITVTNIAHDTRVAGVISTNPAYLMNSDTIGLPVALTGRVPCLVKGPVSKGDVLVTSVAAGAAQKINPARFQPGCVIGKSLENIPDSELKIVEVVVGRF